MTAMELRDAADRAGATLEHVYRASERMLRNTSDDVWIGNDDDPTQDSSVAAKFIRELLRAHREEAKHEERDDE